MKLYHATTKRAWESIKKDRKLKTCLGQICLTDELRAAIYYGEHRTQLPKEFGGDSEYVVLQVDSDDLDKKELNTYYEMICKILNIKHFYSYWKDIPIDKIKKL